MKTKWLLRCFNVFAVILILASVFVLLSVVFTPAGQVPQVLGFSVFRVMTGSMEPEIPRNAFLLVKKTDPQAIEAGDIITFFSQDPELDGAVNTHRVVRREQGPEGIRFITKGDANILEDTYPVPQERLIGKAVFVSGVLGKAVSILSNPLVFVALVLIPLLVILIRNLWHAIRIAMDMAKQEEEAAVRQALEAMQSRKRSDTEK